MREFGFILDNTFDYLENFMNFIASQIRLKDSYDVKNIADILQNTKITINQERIEPFGCKVFDFVTPDGKVIASSEEGIIDNPLIVKPGERLWMTEAPKNPFKLIISGIGQGITVSNTLQIPTISFGLGITDKDGVFRGTISSGILLNKLKDKLKEVIDSDDYSYIVLDNNLNYMFYSNQESNVKDFDKNDLQYKLQYLQDKKERFGTLNETIFIDGVEYMFYNKANNYPFVVIVGINRKDIHDFRDMEIKMLELESAGKYNQLFLLALLYVFELKIINPVTGQKNYSFDFEIPKIFSKHINKLFLSLEQIESFMELKIQKEVAEEIAEEKEQLMNSKEVFFRGILSSLDIPMKSIGNEKFNISQFLEEIKDKISQELSEKIKHSVNNINSSTKSVADLIERIASECIIKEEE